MPQVCAICLCFSLFPFSSFVSKEGVTLMMQVYMDGTTTMSTYERKASFHEFYGMFVNGGISGDICSECNA
jgi:hypothetical protein